MNQETAAAPGKKLWRVGTLSYTAGGLLMLCLCLLGGDFPWALKDRAVAPSATLLIRQIGVSELVYGLVIIGFPNFTNLFLSPAICYISDRHRGRWGRRIPFLMFTTPFIVLGLYLLGFSRMLGSRLHGAVPAVSEAAACSEHRLQPGISPLFQIRRLLPGESQWPGGERPPAEAGPACRHQLLHVSDPQLYRRRIPGRGEGPAKPH